MTKIIDLDRDLYFDFKIGGDGDSGEELMSILDVIFNQEDLEVASKTKDEELT